MHRSGCVGMGRRYEARGETPGDVVEWIASTVTATATSSNGSAVAGPGGGVVMALSHPVFARVYARPGMAAA